MLTQGDRQPEPSVLEKLQPYMDKKIEQALEELDLTEESIVLRFWGFELHRVRRITHLQRRQWSRWVSLFGILAALIAGLIKVWLRS